MQSKSENRGLGLFTDKDLKIYSVGISTAGEAEIRMARQNPQRKIIATTVDQDGALYVRKKVQDAQLEEQITVRMEDVSKPLPYQDDAFDLIYARLVLHYLPEEKLLSALRELSRVLKDGGKLYVVVRSTEDPNIQEKQSRFFHSEESICSYLQNAGFSIQSTTTYRELLCRDFKRLEPAEIPSVVIEVVAKISRDI